MFSEPARQSWTCARTSRTGILLRLHPFCLGQRREIGLPRPTTIGVRRCNNRQGDAENRPFLGRLFYNDIPSVILDNFLHHSQPQSSSVFLAITDERLEKLASNRLRDAATVVRKPNLQSPQNFSQIDVDLSILACDRLTRIQQQIVK